MIPIENASVRLFGDSAVRRHTTVTALTDWLGDVSARGLRRALPPQAGAHRPRGRRGPVRARGPPQPRRGLLPPGPGRDRRHRCLRGGGGRADGRHRAGPGADLVRDRALPRPTGRLLVAGRAARPGRAGRGGLQRARAGQRLPDGGRADGERAALGAPRLGPDQPAQRHPGGGEPRERAADRVRRKRQPGHRHHRAGVAAVRAGQPPDAAAPRPFAVLVHQPRAAVPAAPRRGRGDPRPAARAGHPSEAACHRPRPHRAARHPPRAGDLPPGSAQFPADVRDRPGRAALDRDRPAPGPGPAAQGLSDGVRAAAAQRLRPARPRRRPVLARPGHRPDLLLRPVRRPADRGLRRPGGRPRCGGTAAAGRDRPGVPRPPQPVPGPPAGPFRRELRRLRAGAHRSRGSRPGARRPDPGQDHLPAGAAPARARPRQGAQPGAGPVRPGQRLRSAPAGEPPARPAGLGGRLSGRTVGGRPRLHPPAAPGGARPARGHLRRLPRGRHRPGGPDRRPPSRHRDRLGDRRRSRSAGADHRGGGADLDRGPAGHRPAGGRTPARAGRRPASPARLSWSSASATW